MTDETKEADPVIQFPKIEGLAAERNGSRDKHLRCSDCVFWSVHLGDIRIGACHGNPPVFMGVNKEGTPVFGRPNTNGNDLACRHLSVKK